MKVRRCQGWVIGHNKNAMVSGVVQCEQPATDGVRCDTHKDQKPVEWMEEK